MDNKKVIAVAIGMFSVVMLFAIVYSQFASLRSASTARTAPKPAVQQKVSDNRSEATVAPVVVEEPETTEEINAAIEKQLAEDAAAVEAETAAESAAIEADIKSLDDLNNSYDESEYEY